MRSPAPDALVLDTDVTSFLFKKDPVRAPRYRLHTKGKELYVPFIVTAELLYWAERRSWGQLRRTRLAEFLQDLQIVNSTLEVCQTWAEIRADAERRGWTIERQDAWVAAVALALDRPLVTHNASHFIHIPGLRIITEPDLQLQG